MNETNNYVMDVLSHGYLKHTKERRQFQLSVGDKAIKADYIRVFD